MDVDARMQLFDLKTTYQFQTSPGVDKYNMPLYSVQSETPGVPTSQDIAMFPVYQGFLGPVFINGVNAQFHTERAFFNSNWSNFNNPVIQAGTGNGSAGPYTLNLPFLPNNPQFPNFPPSAGIIRGHVDITGVIATGINQDPPLDTLGTGLNIANPANNIKVIPSTSIYSQVYFTALATDGSTTIVQDTGIFLNTVDPGTRNYGLLMAPGPAPYGNAVLTDTLGQGVNYSITQNTINYLTGVATNVTFPKPIVANSPISAQCVYYQQGIPRSVLFFNNCLTLRAPPNTSYLVEIDAYLTPAAFFQQSKAIPFGYMAEYIARGAARKILSDTGDWEQFAAYEPLFIEQETLVHIRSQRQFTSTRTQTIYSNRGSQGNYNQNSLGI